MAFNITYDETTAQYVVKTNDETELIIRPYEKNKSWVGVEYDDMYDISINKDYADMSNNEIINEIDAAIVIETKDLPSMLRELANYIEEGNKWTR